VAHVLQVMAEQGLEGLDTENLRPHCARQITGDKVVRAYRL
jgi:hypothetical protein